MILFSGKGGIIERMAKTVIMADRSVQTNVIPLGRKEFGQARRPALSESGREKIKYHGVINSISVTFPKWRNAPSLTI